MKSELFELGIIQKGKPTEECKANIINSGIYCHYYNMAQPLHMRNGSSLPTGAKITYIEPADMSGDKESELFHDTSPLTQTDDGKVIVPMHAFEFIFKKSYGDAWASTAVRYLPAFTPAAFDKESCQVDLNHTSSRDNKFNRKRLLQIVREDIFGSGIYPYVRNAYVKYIRRLYSNEIYGELDDGDYPFELDGRVPQSIDDLLDVFFDTNGPGMRLMRAGNWERLCAWYYIVGYWVTSETHDGRWMVEGLQSYYDAKGWRISLDCSHSGRKNRSVHPLVRIAKKKACDNMKNMFRKKMGILYGRTLEFQATMKSPPGLDERDVNIGKYLPKVIKSKMMRLYGCRFRMKLLRENEGNDLKMAISLSVQGAAKAAMEGGMSQEDLEELVGNVIRGVYEEDDDDGEESASPQGGEESASLSSMPPLPPRLPAMSTVAPLFAVAQNDANPSQDEKSKEHVVVRRSPSRGKYAAGEVRVAASLIDKMDKMNTSNKQSEKRGEKRVGATVDDDLVAAKHKSVEIGWKRGAFTCYHCPNAFSKEEKCVFVFCMWCHGEKMTQIAEKTRGVVGTNNNGGAANKRRGSRGRAKSAGVKEVNVCENLKKGECGRHTWGDLADLKIETTKSWTWREQTKTLGDDTGFIAKHCFGCGRIL